MCHEYEALWWRREATPKKKAAEPKSRDIRTPEARPVEPARVGVTAREDEKALVPAE
jgi:hypothetical protein